MTGRYGKFAPQLVERGYDVTPLNGKIPILSRWQERPETALDFKKFKAHNIGVLCGGAQNIVALDIDVRKGELVDWIERHALETLGSAPKRIGNHPKSLLVYRCEEPIKKLRSAVFEIDGNDAAVEILADGQQFVASGEHPDTKRNYVWPDDKLLDFDAADLTVVSANALREFVADMNSTLEKYGTIKARSLNGGQPPGIPIFATSELRASEPAALAAAMDALPNIDRHYDDWVHAGLAIKGALGDDGYEIFERWSQRSAKFDEAETRRAWDSFAPTRIGAGSIYRWAAEEGAFRISDWRRGNIATVLKARGEAEGGEAGIKASFPPAMIEAEIPRRRWLLGTHLARGFVSATISPGGIGKSTLVLSDHVALATGETLLHDTPHESAVRSWAINLEDPIDELHRRLFATCKHFCADYDTVRGLVAVNSGRDQRVIVADKDAAGNIVATPDVDALIAEIDRHDISHLSIDPFVRSHWADENSNKEIDAVLAVYADIAAGCNISIDLVHHTRKSPTGTSAPAAAGNIDMARGASALAAAVRSARTVTTMTASEGDAFSVAERRRKWYVRVDDAKGNMRPPRDRAEWFERVSVALENAPMGAGDTVGAFQRWSPPSAWDGVTHEKITRILERIDAGQADGERYTSKSPKYESWCGHVVSDVVPSRQQVHAVEIVKHWFDAKLLETRDYESLSQRKTRKGVFVNWALKPGVIGQ